MTIRLKPSKLGYVNIDSGSDFGSDYGGNNYLGDYTNFDTSTSFDSYVPMDFSTDYNASSYFDNSLSNFDYSFDALDTFNTFDSADYINNIYNASSTYDSFLNDYNTDYFDANTYIDLTPDHVTDWENQLIDTSYGGGFDGLDIDSIGTGLNIGQTFDYLDGININADDFSDYDASTQFAAQDISSFDQGELDILASVGAIDINEDGAVTNFNSQDALRQIEDQLIEYREDLSTEEIAGLTSLRNEILAAEDLGLDSYELDIPLGSVPYRGEDGLIYYTDPSSEASTALAGEGGSVGLLGTDFSNRFLFSGDPSYEANNSDFSSGYINEGNSARNSQVYSNTGGKFNIYGEPIDMRTNPALQGMSFQTRVDKNVPGSIIQGVDTMTDYLRDGAGLLLKPLNWISDGVGGGLDAIGGALGNNPIGRGFSSFGNIVDNTGDYLFGSGDRDSLLGTVFNVPDNLTKTVAGGLSGNWDVAKQGLKGLVAAPFEVAGNALSVPVAIAKDVFGVDEINISASAGAGGGGRGMPQPKRQPPKRKTIGKVLGSGASREGITGVNGSKVSYGGKEYDMSTPEGQQQLLNDSDFGTLAEGISQTGGTSLLTDDQIRSLAGIGNAPGAGPSSGTAEDPIGSTDADRSTLADKMESKQGGATPKVKKTDTAENIENIIDKLAKGSVRKTKPAPVAPTPKTSNEGESLDIFDNDAPLIGEEN